MYVPAAVFAGGQHCCRPLIVSHFEPGGALAWHDMAPQVPNANAWFVQTKRKCNMQQKLLQTKHVQPKTMQQQILAPPCISILTVHTRRSTAPRFGIVTLACGPEWHVESVWTCFDSSNTSFAQAKWIVSIWCANCKLFWEDLKHGTHQHWFTEKPTPNPFTQANCPNYVVH